MMFIVFPIAKSFGEYHCLISSAEASSTAVGKLATEKGKEVRMKARSIRVEFHVHGKSFGSFGFFASFWRPKRTGKGSLPSLGT